MRAAISRSERSTSARRRARARVVERLDQARVAHRRGGMVGQRPDEARSGPGRTRRPGSRTCRARRTPRRRRPAARRPSSGSRCRGRPRSGSSACGERGVRQVVAGHHDRALGDGPAEHARRRPAGRSRGPSSRPRWLSMPASCAKRRMAGRRVEQVDHRPVGVEQAGGLVDGGRQQVVDVAAAAVRVVPAARRRSRSCGGGLAGGARRSGAEVATARRIRRAPRGRHRRSTMPATSFGRAAPGRPSSRADGVSVSRDSASLAHASRRAGPTDDAARRRRPDRPASQVEVNAPMFASRDLAPHLRRRRPRRHRRPDPGDRRTSTSRSAACCSR